MSHLDSLGTGNDLGHESVVDVLVDEEPRRTGTHLSLCGDTQVKGIKKWFTVWIGRSTY